MYSWTVSLPEETKISDAYQMLKKQGNLTCRVLICHNYYNYISELVHVWSIAILTLVLS